MPRREYPKRDGKYGGIYKVARGITVRRDNRQQWCLEITRKGERKSRTMGVGPEGRAKAMQAAEEAARRLRNMPKAKKSAVAAPSKPSLLECARKWHADNQNRWSPVTVDRYEDTMRIHMEPQAIYRQPIDRVTRDQIKASLRELAKRRSPATVESVHAVVSSVFEEGIDSGLLGSNPARGLLKKILPPKNQRDLKDPAPMTVEERDRMIATAERVCCRSMQLVLKAMALMGFRLGEVLAMREKHIDRGRLLYHVVEAYKCQSFRKPKGGKSRFVDIPESLAVELEEHVMALKKEGLQAGRGGQVDLLFVKPEGSERGWPFSQRDVQCELKRVCKAAGLEVRNPHDLRHTYATTLLMAGMSPAYVQRQLGHSSIAITVDIYGHWVPGEGRAGLEAALAGGAGKGSGEEKIVPFSVP